MIWILWIAGCAAAAYQLVALAAVLRHLSRKTPRATRLPSVSILKPVHGRDPFFEEAIESHTKIDYPAYQVLFAVHSLQDAAMPALRAIGARVFESRERTANAKVGSLMELSRHAEGEIWVVNDGDILVEPSYLREVVAPLENEGVALVTCLYRPRPEGLPAAWESLGIATEFAPSTLVAPLVGINEFGLGSTLCFRRADLERIGGFAPIAEYLADDYQLARRLTRGLGKRSYMSRFVVETSLGYATWGAMAKHQIRWARTIRVSRGDGYWGLPVTYAGVWSAVAFAAGLYPLALALLLSRWTMAYVSARLLLRSNVPFLLAPLWDVWALMIWGAGLRGNIIEWRGGRMRLLPDGRLREPISQ